MNTSFQKTVLNLGNIGESRRYTWDKSWVRPYESPLSAYINFVNLNATRGTDLARLWGFSSIGGMRFDERLKCEVARSRGFADGVIKEILPNAAEIFPDMTGQFGYRRTFRYCPECIRQGYHTLLGQMPDENVCPIHNERYIDSEICLPIGMAGGHDEYSKALGMDGFPLIYEREPLDYSLIGERLGRYNGISCIGRVSAAMLDPGAASMVSVEGASHRCLVKKIDAACFDYAGFIDGVWDYFNKGARQVYTAETFSPQAGYETLKEALVSFRRHVDACSGNVGSLMELACLLNFIKDARSEDYPGTFPYIRQNFSPCMDNLPVTRTLLMASYCYSVRGCNNLPEIFEVSYVWRPSTSASKDVSFHYSTSVGTLASAISDMRIPERFRRKRGIQDAVAAACIYDQFWFQSERYMRLGSNKKHFDFYRQWKNVSPLIYEIDYA